MKFEIRFEVNLDEDGSWLLGLRVASDIKLKDETRIDKTRPCSNVCEASSIIYQHVSTAVYLWRSVLEHQLNCQECSHPPQSHCPHCCSVQQLALRLCISEKWGKKTRSIGRTKNQWMNGIGGGWCRDNIEVVYGMKSRNKNEMNYKKKCGSRNRGSCKKRIKDELLDRYEWGRSIKNDEKIKARKIGQDVSNMNNYKERNIVSYTVRKGRMG